MKTKKFISKFHFITGNALDLSYPQLAEQVCRGGCDWLQLRAKDLNEQEFLDLAIEIKAICDKFHAKLIINDHVLIAKKVNASGVHLGKSDMPVPDARKILGNDAIIGGTANTFEDILRLNDQQADYIGLGPFRFTATKKNLSPVLGLEGYKKICRQCKEAGIEIPVIAIGGIMMTDVSALMDTGIHGPAVSSAITNSGAITEMTKRFLNTINEL